MSSLLSWRRKIEQQEELFLAPCAAFSKHHSRFDGAEHDHRLPYKRDVDRILHSKAYARCADKTQVVYLVDNDHLTRRFLHVQLVSGFARGIADILGLNSDLVEAIALGHDVGHPPFGHEGEGYLSELSEEYQGTHFAHSVQSCRLFFTIEPLRLGLAVYDGFLCHDGGMDAPRLVPQFDKTWDIHFEQFRLKGLDPDLNLMPSTLEGCLVKLCDTISYLGKDLEDAIELGLLKRHQVPDLGCGTCNRDILNAFAQDILENSYQKEYIALSPERYAHLRALRRFNFENIYVHPKLKVESKKIKKMYRLLFETLLEQARSCYETSHVSLFFSAGKSPAYLANTPIVQQVVDYIASMTDRYFVNLLQQLFIPGKISL